MRFGMFIEMLVNEIYLNALGRFTLNTFIYLTPSKYKLYIIHVWGHLFFSISDILKFIAVQLIKTLNKGKCMDLYVRQRKFVY